MKCKSCGEEIPCNCNFCEYCGSKVGKKSTGHVPSILYVILGAIVIITTVALFLKYHDYEEKKISESNKIPILEEQGFSFDGIRLDFNMNLKEMYNENNKSVIKRFERKGNWDEDVAEYYYAGYFYYLIDGKTAIEFNDTTQCIELIRTKSRSFSAPGDIHVGDLWGKMVKTHPNLKFYTDFLYYNHFTQTQSPATIAYDETLNVAFVFYLEQFSQEQWESICSVSNASGFDTDYETDNINRTIYQTICNTIKVDEIEMWKR